MVLMLKMMPKLQFVSIYILLIPYTDLSLIIIVILIAVVAVAVVIVPYDE